jgi:hypothetical protein
MSDFDAVLERLVSDPGFAAALRADPEGALRGYQLDADERAVLSSQVDLGPGAAAGDGRTVEMRVSKSSMAGMLGPITSALGLVTTESSGVGGSALPPSGHGVAGFAPGQGGGHGDVTLSAGSAPDHTAAAGMAPGGTSGVVASDYHTWVDADGDGKWDHYVAYERPDGGVDVAVDTNGDGTVDFVGHDYNRDGIIDSADVDENRDGVFETHLQDIDGDGWMDTRRLNQDSGDPEGDGLGS